MEVNAGAVYVLGVHDSVLLFVQKHNLTTLELMVHKVFMPSNTSMLLTFQDGFKSLGLADDKLYAYYISTADTQSIIMFNATTLSIIKHWETAFSNELITANRWWSNNEPNG